MGQRNDVGWRMENGEFSSHPHSPLSTLHFPFIPRRDKEDNLYKRLQEESLTMIQALSGKRWTDYNEHDPGITFLDVLNYALLELSYQLEFPFEKLLAEPLHGDLCFEKVGLLPPQEVFEPVIVTTQDYELLIIHSIDGVNDCRVIRDEFSLYIIIIEPGKLADVEIIRKAAEELYHSHRNLCENLGEIRFEEINDKKNRFKLPESIDFEKITSKIQVSGIGKFPYRSVQYDLPDCYGINERGLPPGVPPERGIEALQLKAYLLIFDYLISGVHQQTESIHRLLELSGSIPAQFRPDMDMIDACGKLLDTEKAGHTEIFDAKEMLRQKVRFFDYLDMLYGEDTQPYQFRDSSPEFRAKLIRRFPELNTCRFRSFNLLDKKAESIAGIEFFLNTVMMPDEDVNNPFPEYCRHCDLRIASMHENHLFYFVEHILLWDENTTGNNVPVDSNRLSIIIPLSIDRIYARETYLKLLEERLPAHLDIRCIWLGKKDVKMFVRMYFGWRRAWAYENRGQIIDYSNEIRDFING